MSSVGVLMEKKSKCPKKNFQSVKKGRKKCKCRISGVRKKRRVPREKKSKCFFLDENFAKFVFTGWVLC